MKWCQVAEYTIVDWCNFCREVCAIYTSKADYFEQIGGPGCVVEIDKSNSVNGGITEDDLAIENEC